MEYKKIEEKAYNLHLIKSKKFKKIRIKINFKEKLNKENIVYRNMLSLILLESSKQFNSKRLLDIECEELYTAEINTNTTISGNYNILTFNTVFLNEKYTEVGMNERTFQFFLSLIMEPNVDNKKFNKESFKIAKQLLIEDIESFEDAPPRLAMNSLYKSMLPGSGQDLRSVGYMEDLKTITEENLYTYYQKLLKNNLIDIFVIGDFEDSEMKKIISENFKINTIKKKSETHLLKHKKTRVLPKTVVEEKNLSQSILLIGSKITNINEFERLYTLSVYNAILGGNPDSKLFKEIREKNSLCYSITSSYSGVTSLEVISAGIDQKDFKKAVTLIKKEIKKMESGDFSEEQIEQAKTTYLSSLKEIEDTQSGMINMYEAYEYLGYDLIKERQENIKKVTKKDIIKISKKIHLDTIYLLKGVKNNEN